MPIDQVLYDKDADLSVLKGKTVAILGYGSQGHAHALNLRTRARTSSSVSARIRRAEGRRAAREPPRSSIADAASRGESAVTVLFPDEKQAQVWREEIADGIAEVTC